MNRSIRSLLVIVFFATLVLTPWTAIAQDGADPTQPSENVDEKAGPRIVFTTVPPYGGFDDLKGRVANVVFSEYRVAVYIYTNGWYNKPYWNARTTLIDNLGRWTCDITTGVGDQRATQICAFLIPQNYTPPRRAGHATLPQVLYARAVAKRCVTRSR